MKTTNFNFKSEELPVYGDFVGTSFEKDKEHFVAFSPEYSDGFSEQFKTTLVKVKEVVSPTTYTSQMKQATEKLHNAEDEMLVLANHIERYCQKSSNLTFSLTDLKMKDLRTKIKGRDAEGIVKCARNLLQVIAPSLTILEQKGYTAEKQARVVTLINTIDSENLAQNSLMNERRRLVAENTQLLNDFWVILDDIMKTGRIIFKDNAVKKAEYIKAKVLKRVRIVRKAKEEDSTGTTETTEKTEK